MLWSVCIATQARRADKLARLLGVLLPQAEQALGAVEVVALYNNADKTIHEYRQALLDDARGDYISFVDDDDMVTGDFIETVVVAMWNNPGTDYIAFRHAYYESGVFDRETRTGLHLGPSRNLPEYFVRVITHINPVRMELARQAGFTSAKAGEWEDHAYDMKVAELAKTEVVIPRPLYHYYHDWRDSILNGPTRLFTVPRRPVIPSPAFRWHPWSLR